MASDGRAVRHAFHHKLGDGFILSDGNIVAEGAGGHGTCWTVFSCDPANTSEAFTVKLTSISVGRDVQTYCMISILSVIYIYV